ncbi:MAG: hypothetical protein HY751_12785 [Nitrospinae bacterium]|nr:hypothetical protein [Nitrospinota bacterium]
MKVTVYALIHDDPYAVGELMSVLPRQSEPPMEIVSFIPYDLSDASMKRIEKRSSAIIVVPDLLYGSAVNRAIAERDDDVIVFLDSSLVPSNQVWMERLTHPIIWGDVDAVAGRMAQDLYTNFFIQNDFAVDLKKAEETGRLPFFHFMFSNLAGSRRFFLDNPFPALYIEDFILGWAIENSGKVTYCKDAVIHPLIHFTADGYMLLYQRLARALRGRVRFPLFRSVDIFFRGIWRDFWRMYQNGNPLWMFYSIYMRLIQAFGFYSGSFYRTQM